MHRLLMPILTLATPPPPLTSVTLAIPLSSPYLTPVTLAFPLSSPYLTPVTLAIPLTPPYLTSPFFAPSGMLVLHGLEAVVAPPPRYPDLYPALFSLYGACNLLVVYVLGVTWQWSLD